ncbi:hypothetical protein GCM10010191_61980 [Actinomadura vinacea]|uniref:Uncharacterized protein n=1 Tax=Actinomadura vinacea TaxID=115336 RepID=A0ABN3JRN4_9ACTN
MAKPERPERPDIEIRATVQARELVFHRPPTTRIDHAAEPVGESASGSDGTNLPERVEAHVTYRNVHIDFRLAAELDPEAPQTWASLPLPRRLRPLRAGQRCR